MVALASIVSFVLAFAPQEGKAQEAKPQEKNDAGVEALSYAAFKLETEQRDFKAALAAWTRVLDASAKVPDSNLATKAQLGRARCLEALGNHTEAGKAVAAVLAKDPENEEAKKLRAELGRRGRPDGELAGEARELLDVYLGAVQQNTVDESIQAVRADLIRMGDAAVPELALRLRDVHSRVVEHVAGILTRIETEKSLAALAEGILDPAIAYPAVLANAPQDRIQASMLPIARAAFGRKEKALHDDGAGWLISLRDQLPTRDAVKITRELLADPDPSIRRMATKPSGTREVALELIPEIDRLIATDDEARQLDALTFLSGHRAVLPTEVVERWTIALGRSNFPNVRIQAWNGALNEARGTRGRESYFGEMERSMLALLGDDDPQVFSHGAGLLAGAGDESFKETRHDQHAKIHDVARRAIEIVGVSAKDRGTVLERVPADSLDDEELFDLFTRLADRPADLSDARRAGARERFARTIMGRHVPTPEARDAFAATMFRRIQDVAGMKTWLNVVAGSGDGHWRDSSMPELDAAVASSGDREIRKVAYEHLAKRGGVPTSGLPHLSEDLAGTDVATQLTVLRSIRWGLEPAVLPAVRAILANATGELRRAALDAMVTAGGGAVAADLLAEFERAPSEFNRLLFRTIEPGIGSEALARKIVEVVTADVTLVKWTLPRWVDAGNTGLSAAAIDAVVRGLPKEALTIEVVSSAAAQITPDVIRPLVLGFLESSRRDDVIGGLALVTRLRIDAGWPRLVALLDAGDGEIREKAIAALGKLREYRDLKRTLLADDGDVRREAFEKARTLALKGTVEQRAASALALAATGDVAAIPLLLDLIGDENTAVRAAAKLALEKLAERAAPPMPAEAPKKGEEKKPSGN